MAERARRWRWLLAAVFAWAALLRFSGIGWDGFRLQHPDERFLAMVAMQLRLPASPAQAVSPGIAPGNPNNRGFSFYVYGALPPLAVHAVSAAVGVEDVRGVSAVARILSTLMDLLAMALAVALAARLGGEGAALVAGTLYASCPLLIQQARFGTTDAWGMAASMAVMWSVLGRAPGWRRLALAGAAVGVAAACKPNLALTAVVPLAAVAVAWWGERRRGWRAAARALARTALVGAAALAALKLTDPGAFAAAWSVLPSPRRLAALRQLTGILGGAGQYPPNLQWAGRRAVLSPLANLLVWGTGPLLGGAVAFGVARVMRRAVLGSRTWWPALAWGVPAAAWHLAGFAVPVRHLAPFLPLAIVAAALWLAHRRPWLRRVVVGGTVVVGLAWASVAWHPYTRVAASRWLHGNLPDGATVTAEYWDDALPLADTGPGTLRTVTMRVFDPDTAAKREQLLAVLDEADAVVLASQRGVGSICRVPDAYPLTSEYYHLLFSGALGFRPAATFQRRIGFGPLSVSDLAAEEALSVYDHPPVWIFVKTPRYSPQLARTLLDRVALPGAAAAWDTVDLEARGVPAYLVRGAQRGTLPSALPRGAAGQLAAVVLWLAALEILGLAGGRVLTALAPGLGPARWGVARWLGMAGAGLAWMWSGWLGVPGWNGWLPALALAAAAPWAVREVRRVWRQPGFRLAALVVWAAFVLFLAIRAGNPEIYWGEKPMDAAVLGSLWRASAFPPVDPWFAGAPLDYYFFGAVPYAFLARAVGVPPGVAYNLVAATVPALAAGCAAAVGLLLGGRRWGAVLAAVLAQLTGTAAVLVRPAMLAAPSSALFWASSRVIPDTINEYPVWTALFADLHAHFFGFAGFLAAVALLSGVAVGRVRGRRGAALTGVVLAVEAITNTWEAPLLAVLLLAALLWRPAGVATRRSWVGGASFMALAGLAGAVAAAPFWLSVHPAAGGVALARAPAPPAGAMLELFGIPLGLTAVALAATLWRRGERPETAWAWLLVGAGTAAALAPFVITVADHMNTVFKLHLQAQLLLAVGLAGVLSREVPALARGPRRLLGALAASVVAVGLLTTAADVRSVLATRRVPGPRPTLDGAAYLEAVSPGQAAVLGALQRLPSAPAELEPPGRPYSDTLRVPMFTGLPAVVGWPYHLWQRHRSRAEIRLREADTTVLLYGTDAPLVDALRRRYGVGAASSWDGEEPAVARIGDWPALVAGKGGGAWVTPRAGGVR